MIIKPTKTRVGALLRRSGNGTAIFGGPTLVTWDFEFYDTHDFHSLTANPERLVIPTGMDGNYLVSGGIELNTVALSYCVPALTHYNNMGTIIAQQFYPEHNETANWSKPVLYGPVPMSGGDYVQIELYQYTNSSPLNNLIGAGSPLGTYFGICEVLL